MLKCQLKHHTLTMQTLQYTGMWRSQLLFYELEEKSVNGFFFFRN